MLDDLITSGTAVLNFFSSYNPTYKCIILCNTKYQLLLYGETGFLLGSRPTDCYSPFVVMATSLGITDLRIDFERIVYSFHAISNMSDGVFSYLYMQ